MSSSISRLASVIGPFISPLDITKGMAENANGNSAGIKISGGTATILVFLVAELVGGVWWASAQNTKMDTVINTIGTNATAQTEKMNAMERRLTDRIDAQDKRMTELDEYNQNTREFLAGHGLFLPPTNPNKTNNP